MFTLVFEQSYYHKIFLLFCSLNFVLFFIRFSVVFCCLVLVFVLNVISDTQRGTEIPPMPLVHSSPLSTPSKPFVSNVLFNCVPWNGVIRFHKRRTGWAQFRGVKRRVKEKASAKKKKGAAPVWFCAKLALSKPAQLLNSYFFCLATAKNCDEKLMLLQQQCF